MAFSYPDADDDGSFSSSLGEAPGDWPRALPVYVAVNVVIASRPWLGKGPSSVDDPDVLWRDFHYGLCGVEVVGYWHGRFAVTRRSKPEPTREALKSARWFFEGLPARALFHRGTLVAENRSIEVTGDWPDSFKLSQIQAVFAFLWENATRNGARKEADQFLSKVPTTATTGTELRELYADMVKAQAPLLLPHLDDRGRRVLANLQTQLSS